MAKRIRHQPVSVGIIYQQDQGFLLFFNEKWNGYAFCMKKPNSGDDLAEIALTALGEDSPLEFPEASARPLEVVGAYGPSGSGNEDTYYDYHLHEIDAGPQRSGVAADRSARFFSYEQLMSSDEVTWSTKDIARSIMEYQEAGLAVVVRVIDGTPQYLLAFKPGYGYFFPTARRKENESAEDLAVSAVRLDTLYEGELKATWCQEVVDVHEGTRFGGRSRKFIFQVCVVEVTGVDLTQKDNPFDNALRDHERAQESAGIASGSRGFADWFTEEELRNHSEMSPTVNAVLSTVLAHTQKQA